LLATCSSLPVNNIASRELYSSCVDCGSALSPTLLLQTPPAPPSNLRNTNREPRTRIAVNMRLSTPLAFVALLAHSDASSWMPGNTAGTDWLAQKTLQNQAQYAAQRQYHSGCTPSNTYVRREWLSLPKREKKAYITAVQCLQTKPSISGTLAPGAKSRFDDFVATHINQTLTIHGTVSNTFRT